MKHTKGPWTYKIDKSSKNWVSRIETVEPHNSNISDNGTHLATLNSSVRGVEQNARLIAAAPEMLKALENAQESINQALGLYKNKLSEDLRNELLHIYTSFIPAIKKAKGE